MTLEQNLDSFESKLKAERTEIQTSFKKIKIEIRKLEDQLSQAKNDVYLAELMLNSTLEKLKRTQTLNRALRRKDLAMDDY